MNAQMLSKPMILEPKKKSAALSHFEKALRERFVGQDEAVKQLADVFQTVLAGMTLGGRPIANLLFLGPTGSGKTRLVEAAAEILFGSPSAFIKIDCAEFQHSHEISKLIGSPPGYIGHRETQPAITQQTLDQSHTEKLKLSFVLFDEIEKANDALWQLLLGILDKAVLTLGDNRKVDFSRTVVFMTSNLGASEMTRLVTGGIGFAPATVQEQPRELDRRIQRVAIDAAKRRFSPEFMNRIDKVVVFQTLHRDEMRQVLDLELAALHKRIMQSQEGNVFAFECTPTAKEFLLNAGADPQYGARHLKRAIERHLVAPLASLIATGQVEIGDIIEVDVAVDGESLVFTKQDMKFWSSGGGSGNSPDVAGPDHYLPPELWFKTAGR